MIRPARMAAKFEMFVLNRKGNRTGRTVAPMLLIEMNRLAAIPTFDSETPCSVSWQ